MSCSFIHQWHHQVHDWDKGTHKSVYIVENSGYDDGNVYDENGYLFEDWYSIGPGGHSGIRDRVGDWWETGWYIRT